MSINRFIFPSSLIPPSSIHSSYPFTTSHPHVISSSQCNKISIKDGVQILIWKPGDVKVSEIWDHRSKVTTWAAINSNGKNQQQKSKNLIHNNKNLLCYKLLNKLNSKTDFIKKQWLFIIEDWLWLVVINREGWELRYSNVYIKLTQYSVELCFFDRHYRKKNLFQAKTFILHKNRKNVRVSADSAPHLSINKLSTGLEII